jgi:pimeloyl-ACP methyl ester carboxylesterase
VPDATRLPEFDERWLEAKAARIRYFVAGAGQPLVLVHGLGGAAVNWVDLAPLLARDHLVVALDLPGHAGSSPLPAAPNLDAFADRVGAVADAEGLRRPVVAGHSLGGLVALRLALRRAGDVAGVVLAGAAGFSPSGRRAEHAVIISSLVRPGRLLAPYRGLVARSRALRAAALGWGVADVDSLSPGAIEGFLAGPALHTDTGSAARALVIDDFRDRVADIRCPSLVLWGARDKLTPVSDAYDYARRLGSRLRVIPDCGHLLIGERPDACYMAIAEFSDRVRQLDEAPLETEPVGEPLGEPLDA